MREVIQISIGQTSSQRLKTLALRYGLSLNELATQILTEVSSSIGVESLNDYQQPRALAASLKRAWKDVTHGRVSTTL